MFKKSASTGASSSGLMLSATALVLLGMGVRANAAIVTIIEGNSTGFVDPSNGEVENLYVGGVRQLVQQSLFYRIGNTGPEKQLSSLTPSGIVRTQSSMFLNYTSPGFTVSVSYGLSAGPDSTSQAQLLTEVFFNNTTNTPLDLHVFQYDHFTVHGSTSNNALTINNEAGLVSQTSPGKLGASVTVSPVADRFQGGFSPSILSQLTDSLPTTLNDTNSSLSNGNLEFAMETDSSVGAFGTLPVISIETFNPGVPVPAAFWMGLTTLGAIGAVGLVRRKTA